MNTDPQKQSKNLYDLAANFDFGALLWWKKYPILSVTIFFIWNAVSVSFTVSVNLGFGFNIGPKPKYRISSYSFRGNYSFLNLEIQRSQYIRPKVTVHKCVETIQGRKLFKGRNYMRKYGNLYIPAIHGIGRYLIQQTNKLSFKVFCRTLH